MRAAVVFALVVLAAGVAAALCPGELGAAVDGVLGAGELNRTAWGVLVADLPGGNVSAGVRTLVARGAARFFQPASNNKLLTTSAAFWELGAAARFVTELTAAAAASDAPAAAAAVCLRGGGDPALTAAQLASGTRQLVKAAGAVLLGAAAVDVVVDSSLYGAAEAVGDALPATWELDDVVADYGAAPSAVVVDENTATVEVAPGAAAGVAAVLRFPLNAADAVAAPLENRAVTVAAGEPTELRVAYERGRAALTLLGNVSLDAAAAPRRLVYAVLQPELRAARLVAQTLADAGVAHVRPPVRGRCAAAVPTPAARVTHRSAPLADLMRWTLKNSDNLYAETFLNQLGVAARAAANVSADASARELGLARVRALLAAAGVAADGFVQADGSGLSRHNLVSPAALLQTLVAAMARPDFDTYRSFLPVAGVDGTLAPPRFAGSDAQGIVFAKTGTESGISALSGYMLHAAYQPVLFAIVVNQSDRHADVLRAHIDAIVELLPQLRNC